MDPTEPPPDAGTKGAECVTLRSWKEEDLSPFAEMNADPEVMRYFLGVATREESRALFARLRETLAGRGWGLWAVDVDGRFAGYAGLAEPSFTASFTPCVEIGWRFRREFWGRGLAFAGARLAERHAFESLRLSELVSFTTEGNLRSRRLMERLGFTRDPAEDFMHPKVPEGHPLRPHVLYRKRAPGFR